MNFFFKKITTFLKNTNFLQKHAIFRITRFSKITLFQNHAISKITIFQKITLFQKSHYLQNHAISKITRFQSHRPCLQNHAIFYHSLLFLKLPCFKKKFPFKVHFGFPLFKICKKPVFSLQDLGFRLGNMIQTHN